tara:strand:- start:5950 stop:6147 length:198 start_codon:yes stop_codon:yes gene_type:complete
MEIDPIFYKELMFIYNSLDQGWTVKKFNNKYLFSKKHKQKTKYFKKKYLQHFLKKNLENESNEGT